MKKKRNTKRKQCCYCRKLFDKRGLHKHERFCLENPEVKAFGAPPTKTTKKNKVKNTFAELLRPGLQGVIQGTLAEPQKPKWPYFEITCGHCGHAMEVLLVGDTATIKNRVRVGMITTEQF